MTAMSALCAGTARALKDPLVAPLPLLKKTFYPHTCASLQTKATASSDKAIGGLPRSVANKLPSLQKKKKRIEDDPWESFFQQLEKDLENDPDFSNEADITEEDVANFEKELDILLQDIENISTNDKTANESVGTIEASSKEHLKDNDEHDFINDKMLTNPKQDSKDDRHKGLVEAGDGNRDQQRIEFELADSTDEDFSDDDFEEPRTVNLQKWQVRKLAAAVELGRRKVQIKSLAAELKLDREDVLYFLKSPPPELLMAAHESEEEANENTESIADVVDADTDMKNDSLGNSNLENATLTTKPTYGPRDWYKQKRIKKVNKLTLQRVFKRTKWPSDSMIESVVQATHLPRARILEWFEEERAKAGLQCAPIQKAPSRKLWKKPVPHSFDRL